MKRTFVKMVHAILLVFIQIFIKQLKQRFITNDNFFLGKTSQPRSTPHTFIVFKFLSLITFVFGQQGRSSFPQRQCQFSSSAARQLEIDFRKISDKFPQISVFYQKCPRNKFYFKSKFSIFSFSMLKKVPICKK